MPLLDEFTGAVGALTAHISDSGHSWVNLIGTNNLTGNGSIEPGVVATEAMTESSWVPSTNNVEVEIIWDTQTSISGSGQGAFLRETNSGTWASATLYFWQWHEGTLYIYKYQGNGIYTLLNSVAHADPTDGDVFTFSVGGAGPVNLVLKKNGAVILNATDSTPPYYTTGKVGVRTYQTPAINVATGYKILSISATEVAPPGALDPPTEYHATILANGDAEITWQTVAGVDEYNIYRAPASGGTFALVGTVLQADPHFYQDAGFAVGNVYKIKSVSVGVEGLFTATEIVPNVYFDSGLTGVSEIDNSGLPRHDLLSTGDLATWDRLHYTQKSVDVAKLGPTSQAQLFDDVFDNTTPLSLVTSGSVLACGGNSCSVAAGTTLRYAEHVPAPTFNMQVDFLSAPGDFRVGYGSDTTHGVYARYDAAAETVGIYTIDGGAETELMAPVNFPLDAGDKISLECANRIYVVWADIGAGWQAVGNAVKAFNAAIADLRLVSQLNAWYPIAIFDDAATISRMRLSAFGGTNYMREHAAVTYPDGSAVQLPNGRYMLGADRCGLIHDGAAGNPTLAVCFAIHDYDPVTGFIIGGSIATISQVDENGLSISTSDSKIIYDVEAGGFHCLVNDWTGWTFDSFPVATKLYYQFYPGGTLKDFVHLATAQPVVMPAGFVESFYGVDAIRVNGEWYVAGTRYSGSGTIQVPTVIKGATLDTLDTLVADDPDTEHYSEGFAWLPLGSRLYLIGGDIWNFTYATYVWDFSDLTNLVFKGVLDSPAFATGGSQSLAVQVTVIWYVDPNDATKMIPQLVRYTGPVYDLNYDVGRTFVLEPDVSLGTWQFPLRAGANYEFEASANLVNQIVVFSAEGEGPGFLANVVLAHSGATFSATATAAPPNFTASGVILVHSGATIAAAATVGVPGFSGAVNETYSGANFVSTATAAPPNFQSSATGTHSGATFVAAAAFTGADVFGCSVVVTHSGATITSTAESEIPEFIVGSAALTIASANIVVLADAEIQDYVMSATLTLGAAELDAITTRTYAALYVDTILADVCWDEITADVEFIE